MKSVGILTNTRESPLGIFLKENLETVLAGYVNVNCYYLSELAQKDYIKDDLVLVMVKSKALEAKQYIPDARRMLVVRRTIRENEVYKIFAIPHNTKVLVVNDIPETTLEMIALLYQLGINHLNLVSCWEATDCEEIKIAITPGETSLVPKHITTIIDIGHRYIDISTFIQIISSLGINDREVSQRLLKYSEETISLDSGIRTQYKELYIKNTELDALLNLSHEGVLLLNTQGSISLYNKSLERMLDFHGDVTGRNAVEILAPEILKVTGIDGVKDEVIEYKGRSLLVNKRNIEYFGEPAGTCLNFQEVTYIKQLEQNLTRKLRDKGMVARYSFSDIRTKSPQMMKCISFAKEMARSDLTVLITGASGTGKEMLAQSIHNASPRNKQPFVACNCAAIPEGLMESELFGYDSGAFTGALKEGKAGLFEQANNGTIFLDEIGDMPYSLQAKLLRVLQERQVMRVGSQRMVSINIRVVAATNHDLREKIKIGQFRPDLFYRLNVMPLLVPPLCERTEDILYLLDYFMAQSKRGKAVLSPDVRDILLQYCWPGNIRELANVAAYISFMAGEIVSSDALPHYIYRSQESFETELAVLTAKCDHLKAYEILRVVTDFENLDRGAGRKSIEKSLRSRGLNCTEGEIRRILTILDDLEFVSSKVGRGGSKITLKGIDFIKWLRNRS